MYRGTGVNRAGVFGKSIDADTNSVAVFDESVYADTNSVAVFCVWRRTLVRFPLVPEIERCFEYMAATVGLRYYEVPEIASVFVSSLCPVSA